MPSNDSHDAQLLRHYAQFFPNVLFTSEEEMEKYCQEARPDAVKKALDLPEGEEVPEDVMKDPRAHLYILKHIVGRNATTAAFVALRGSDKQKVVAKFIMLNDEKQTAYARSEVHCLAACDHFGIVKHYDDLKSEDKLLLIMEYGSGGDLNKQIKQRLKERLPFKEHEAGLLFYQIVLALDEVHSRKMMHRDLKSANIFLMPTGIIKLGDFGFSKQYTDSVSLDVGSSFCGTPYYLAPELWERKRYSKKADMWSLGVILYELLTLHRPFKGPSQREIMQQVLYGKYDPFPCAVSDGMKALMEPLLSKDPAVRPTTTQLLQTELLKYVANIFEEIVRNSEVIEKHDKERILKQLAEARAKAPPPSAVQPGAVSTDVVREGYLLKYSSDMKWKKRYFSIKNGQLRISLTDNPEKDGVSPKSASLETVNDVFPVPEAYCRSNPHQLVIWFTNGQKIIAMAKSAEERDLWISDFQRACGM
ncbi:putative folate/biopterin transporter [Trypanosoma conorhini]|uniref:non-specific serine/threonine protein kinase n=1 Tax=Trypanosoma conorhini TaxID=83891 RepID=A0A3R7LFL5_9TRYP|nr:putative folate/biopterin transporter [Trypanosoma conorhini]RNF26328.1 putative folate/biopterin transporter [Trypanosoma conorhini]